MATILYVQCDGCGCRSTHDWRNPGQTINLRIRPALASIGWRSVKVKDYCPACVKAGKGPKEKK